MRPDETCRLGYSPIPLNVNSTGYCTLHYMQGANHMCRALSGLKSIRVKKLPSNQIITTVNISKEQLYIFYIFCLNIQCTTNVFGNLSLCIKCGKCCRNEYSIAEYRNLSKLDPKTNLSESYGICDYLEYHSEFDNNISDLGYRCAVYGTSMLPVLCRDYPDGKTEEFFEAWFSSVTGKYKNPLFPNCPFEVKEVI